MIEDQNHPELPSLANLDSSMTVDTAPVSDFSDQPPFPTSVGRTTRLIVLAVLIVEVFVLGLLYVPIPPNPDHEVYDYMAWAALEQGGLYRHGGDMNMPGEALLHIASLALFGNHYWSYRLLEYPLFVVYVSSVGLLGRKYFGTNFAALFVGLHLLCYTSSGYWTTGQRDVLATHGIIIAGFAYLRRADGGRVSWLILAGMAIGSAVLLKPTFLAFGPILVVSAGLFLRRSLKLLAYDTAILGVVGATFLGAFAWLGWATDSLHDWYEMTIVFSAQDYIRGVDSLTIGRNIVRIVGTVWRWFLVLGLAGLIGLILERRTAALSVIFAVVMTLLISTFVQGKGFGYHFAGLLSVFSILGASYLSQIIRLFMRKTDRKLWYLVLTFPALLAAASLISKSKSELMPSVKWYLKPSTYTSLFEYRGFEDVVEAANYARSATKPGDTIWTYTLHPMINSMADRPLPDRFIHPVLLRSSKESALGKNWRREIDNIFRDRPPEFVVLEIDDLAKPDIFVSFQDIKPFEPIMGIREALDRSYVLDRTIGRFVFFRKQNPKPDLPAGTKAAIDPK